MSQSTNSQQSQLNTNNQLQAQQQASQNSLLQANQAAFSPYLSGNVGFTPQQMSALNSQALDQNALQYNGATQATNAQLAARGEGLGDTPASGVQAGAYSNLQASKAGDLADALRTNTLNNAQQALANQFNAGSLLSGNAQTYAGNVGTYGAGANSALGNLTQAQGNTFGTQFGKTLGSALGGSAGAFTGGFGASAAGQLGKSLGWGSSTK